MLLVGITTHTDDFSELTEHEALYCDILKRSNMTPVLIPYTADFCAVEGILGRVDGLMLIGGGDVHPCHYGRILEPGIEYLQVNRDRDLCDLQLARRAHYLDMPTLGICRGNQVLNVALGGTLISDLPTRHRSHPTLHYQPAPYDIPVQKVHVQPGTLLFRIYFGADMEDLARENDIDWVLDVNSMHHQAIEHPAPGLYINALATDGVYEGSEDPSKSFYLGVQWHPEYLENSKPLFDALRDACLARKERPESERPCMPEFVERRTLVPVY